MAKVIESNHNGGFPTTNGGVLRFDDTIQEVLDADNKVVKTIRQKAQHIIMDDAQVEQLMKEFPNTFTIVPEDKWTPKHKAAHAEYRRMQMIELKEKFPDIAKELVVEGSKSVVDKAAGVLGLGDKKKEAKGGKE